MRKKILFSCLVFVAVLTTTIFFFLSNNKNLSQPTGMKDNQNIQLVSIDKFVRQPDLYKEIVAVSGIVKKSLITKSIFILGCMDNCIRLPVKYDKQLPKPDTRITVIGKLEKTKEGKYIFNAMDIKNEK